mmetsp:Transcript_1479/g.2940  ORF Transcript_1479/g.2940 Transcript_1479/m.2940 type:complete len:321 (+) Transcript_1479:223-1185(+)
MAAWAGSLLDEQLGDLHGVEGSALEKLVARDEHVDAVAAGLRQRRAAVGSVGGDVVAHAADKDLVQPRHLLRLRVLVVDAVVHHADPGGFVEDLVDLGERDAPAELQVDALAMRPQHRHSHARYSDTEGTLEYFRGLFDHLPLLLVVAVVLVLRRVVAKEVPNVLSAEDLLRDGRLTHRPITRLLLQLLHRIEAGAAGRLVGGNDSALNLEGLVQREHGHVHQDCRAIRVGDDVVVPLDRMWVDLWHNQRALGVHAEDGAVVDDDAAGGRCLRCPLLAESAAGREQADVKVVERAILHRLTLVGLAAELDGRTLFARVGE